MKNKNGQKIDVKVYVLYHTNGLAMLYVNKTNNYTISEELEFDLENCHIDGLYGNYVEICVKPNIERLLKIVKNKGVANFNAKITKLYYTID